MLADPPSSSCPCILAPRSPPRRALLVRAGAVVAGVVAPRPAPAAAPAWPTRPIRFVVNFPPSGPLDLVGRVLAEHVAASLGQRVLVENRAGEAGTLGAAMVAGEPADGHTVLLSIDAPFTVGASIRTTPAFDPGALRPIALIGTSGSTVAVNPGTGVSTLGGLIALARHRSLGFCSAGHGSPGHLAAAMFGDLAGVSVRHLAYRGNAPAVLALVRGETEAGILGTPGVLPHVHARELVALAVTGTERSPLAPAVPTVAEAGMPGLQLEILYLALVASAVPPETRARLKAALADALAQPALRERLRALDLRPGNESGEALAVRLERLRERYLPIVRRTGMRPG